MAQLPDRRRSIRRLLVFVCRYSHQQRSEALRWPVPELRAWAEELASLLREESESISERGSDGEF